MRTRFALLASLLIAGAVVGLTACQPSDPGASGPSITSPPVPTTRSDADKAAFQSYLADAWYDGEAVAFDEVSGTIDIDTGGSFTGHPASYPEGFVICVRVPAGAVPAEYADDGRITISVKVPTYDTAFPAPDAPCPLVFEPDGVQFREPIHIWVVLPRALQEICGDGYLLYNLERQERDGVETFVHRDVSRVYAFASGRESFVPPGLERAAEVRGGCRNLIRCEVLHFSRWELEDPYCEDTECP